MIKCPRRSEFDSRSGHSLKNRNGMDYVTAFYAKFRGKSIAQAKVRPERHERAGRFARIRDLRKLGSIVIQARLKNWRPPRGSDSAETVKCITGPGETKNALLLSPRLTHMSCLPLSGETALTSLESAHTWAFGSNFAIQQESPAA